MSLGAVCAQLARETTTAPELAPIQQALEALSTAPAYQALADVTNHIKHHGGLPVRVGWGESEQTPFEVLLSAFSRKQQTQPPREIAAFLEETYETMSRGEMLGLTEDEVRFYDALATNESAVKELTDETLKKIAHELTENLRQNLTVDWSERESVRAKLRLMVKRVLRKYKYPPDLQEEAVDLVLRQAQVFGEGWSL